MHTFLAAAVPFSGFISTESRHSCSIVIFPGTKFEYYSVWRARSVNMTPLYPPKFSFRTHLWGSLNILFNLLRLVTLSPYHVLVALPEMQFLLECLQSSSAFLRELKKCIFCKARPIGPWHGLRRLVLAIFIYDFLKRGTAMRRLRVTTQ